MSDKELKVYKLPEELCLPFIAAFRLMERAINPVFSFPFKCSNCGRMSDAQQTQGPQFVMSNKQKNGHPICIGMQCMTEDCGMVIKFMKPISAGSKDWPDRLTEQPESGLEDPKGRSGAKVSTKDLEVIESLLDLS